MPAVQRMGDVNDGGGIIDDIPQSTVYVNGELLAVDGSTGTPHGDGDWETANGNTTVLINGLPVNTDGNEDSCGHIRIDGSGNVNIG